MNAKLDPGTATDSEIRQALRERRAGEPGPTLAGATEGDLDLELTRRLLATEALARELVALVGGDVGEEHAADYAAAAGVDADDLWTAVGRLAEDRRIAAVRTEVGAYRQRDLEKMSPSELRTVRDRALERFALVEAEVAARGNSPERMEAAEYWELLAGAADELLLGLGDE
jgi:hypothetical protein